MEIPTESPRVITVGHGEVPLSCKL